MASASWGGLDLSGAQRSQLATELERLTDELRLKHVQINVLRQLQKQEARSVRVERWKRSVLAPVFSGWIRATAATVRERTIAERAEAEHAKDQQAAALLDRVAKVKANAQAKLSELSKANQQLAAALDTKAKALASTENLCHQLQLKEATDSNRRLQALEATRSHETLSEALQPHFSHMSHTPFSHISKFNSRSCFLSLGGARGIGAGSGGGARISEMFSCARRRRRSRIRSVRRRARRADRRAGVLRSGAESRRVTSRLAGDVCGGRWCGDWSSEGGGGRTTDHWPDARGSNDTGWRSDGPSGGGGGGGGEGG